jgi:hypothetical protein
MKEEGKDGAGVMGKRRNFLLCLSCLTITATGFPGCVWRTIDLYFFFDLWMDYGWTTTLLLITLHLHATGLAKRRRLGGLLGWWERNDWEGGRLGSV